MRVTFRLLAAVTVLYGLMVGGLVHAQPIPTVEIVGLPPGSVVEVALAAANLNKTEMSTASSAGTATSVFDFANLGKTQLDPDERITVYLTDCADRQVRRVVFVAQGGNPPADCDERRADTGEGCTCREIGFFFLRSSTARVRIDFANGTVQAFDGGGGLSSGLRRHLIIGGGVEGAHHADFEQSPPQDGFSGPDADITDTGWSGTFFAEYFFIPWLGVGYGYQSAATADLHETFTFIENPIFQIDITTQFDPSVHDFYGAVQFPPAGRVQGFGQFGINYHTSQFEGTARALANGQPISSIPPDTVSDESSGVGPFFAAGVNVWATDWIGFRARYVFETLRDTDMPEGEEDLEKDYHKFAFMVIVSPF